MLQLSGLSEVSANPGSYGMQMCSMMRSGTSQRRAWDYIIQQYQWIQKFIRLLSEQSVIRTRQASPNWTQPPNPAPVSGVLVGARSVTIAPEPSHSLKVLYGDCEISCLLSSRSMVRIHQGASTTKPLQLKHLGVVQTVCGAPRSVRGTDQIKQSAVGLGDEGASLLI